MSYQIIFKNADGECELKTVSQEEYIKYLKLQLVGVRPAVVNQYIEEKLRSAPPIRLDD